MAIQTSAAQVSQTAQVSKTEMNKFLCFLLQDKTYAVSILRVKEIIEHMEVTPIPMMPDFFLGAINIRGRVVPVVDLRTRLGMDKGEVSKHTCIIILDVNMENDGCTHVGVMVDTVSRVANIEQDDLENAPSFGGNLPTEFIRGIGKVDEKFVIVLNIDELLSLGDLKMISEVSSIKNLEQIAESDVAVKAETNQGDKD